MKMFMYIDLDNKIHAVNVLCTFYVIYGFLKYKYALIMKND